MTIGQVILLFAPVAFVTVCEHIGDHENLGNIIHKDLLNDEPGMKRTLAGDGIATAVSGALCGAANTTYGENVAVIGTTGIASVKVVFLAALMSICIGFFTPFTALLTTIPGCVTGGVSLVLYGFIASSGVKMLIAEKVDFSKAKNIFIASAILVAGIGGLAFKFFPHYANVQYLQNDAGNILNCVKGLGYVTGSTVTINGVNYLVVEVAETTSYSITITSIAVAMILGIVLNVTLREPKVNVEAKVE